MSFVARIFGGGGRPSGPSPAELQAQQQAQLAERQRREAEEERLRREAEASAAAEQQRETVRRRLRGPQGTVLTSPLGVTQGAAPLKTSLGGSSVIGSRL